MSLADARAELASKMLVQIQHETALTWAYRAAAAYEQAQAQNSVKWLLDAEELWHEALEHAALVSDATVAEIRAYLAQFRAPFGL
jgi:hypothetical protein